MASKHEDLQKDLDIIKGNDQKSSGTGARGPNASRQQIKSKKARKRSTPADVDKSEDSSVERTNMVTDLRHKIAHKRRRTESPSSKVTEKTRPMSGFGKLKLKGKHNGVASNPTTPQAQRAADSSKTKQTPRSRGCIDPQAIPIEAIQFKVGWRIEAMDHGSWYKAKIIEVDGAKSEILVHFDGWRAKFDTWYPMTSALIRGRTAIPKKDDGDVIFEAGEDVLARWTDGNFYPATVISVKDTGSCIVMYFDGMKKLIRHAFMKKMNDKEKKIATEAANKLLQQMPDPPIPSSPETAGKPSYRTSATDREKRVAARQGRGSDASSIDSTSELTPVSTPVRPVRKVELPKVTNVTPTTPTDQPAKRKRGRPRKNNGTETPPPFQAKAEGNLKFPSPMVTKNEKENKSSNNVNKLPTKEINASNKMSKQPALNEQNKPVKSKINSDRIHEFKQNHKSIESANVERGSKTTRLDKIISQIAPIQENNKEATTAPKQHVKKTTNEEKVQEFANGIEVVVTSLDGCISYRCTVVKMLENGEYLVKLKKDGTERNILASQIKISTIPPLKIPLVPKTQKQSSLPLKAEPTTSQSSVAIGKSVNDAESETEKAKENEDKKPIVSYSREELVSVFLDGFWYQAKVVRKLNQDCYRIQFNNEVQKIANEKFMKPWAESHNKPDTKTEGPPKPKEPVVRKIERERPKRDKSEEKAETKPTLSKEQDDKTAEAPASVTVSNYKIGDVVLARWSDCKSYPATVMKIKKDGQLVVKYYDGFSKTLSSTLVKMWAPKGVAPVQAPTAAPTAAKPIPKLTIAKPQAISEAKVSSSKTISPSKSNASPTDVMHHHKYKCRAPECNKSFRKESLLLQHHKHYHHQRYKFRDDVPASAKRRLSRDSGSGSGTPKRRVSADYEAIMKANQEPVAKIQQAEDNVSTTPSVEIPRSRGGKPPMNIYRKQQGDTAAIDLSTEDELTLNKSKIEEDDKPETPSPVAKKKRKRLSEDGGLSVEKEETSCDESVDLVVNEDVIRCSCKDDNEIGVMIQCEGCFAWQHMTCAEDDKTIIESEKSNVEGKKDDLSVVLTPGYFCYVCKNPPKCRNALTFLNQNEFLTTGGLRNIVGDKPHNKTLLDKTRQILLLSVNDLVAELTHVHDVLIGVRKKLRIAADSENPQLLMWKELVKPTSGNLQNDQQKNEEEKQRITKDNQEKVNHTTTTTKENVRISVNSNNELTKQENKDEEASNEGSKKLKPLLHADESSVDTMYRCRDNLLDHIIDIEKTMMDQLTQLDGYIDVLQPLLDVDMDVDDHPTIVRNLLQIERDLSATQQLLELLF